MTKNYNKPLVIPGSVTHSKQQVAVVGLGALGSHVTIELLHSGVPSLCLIDPDVLESHNQENSPVYRGSFTAGIPKSIALRQIAARDVRGVSLRAIHAEIADVGLGMLDGVDLLVSCVDSDWARLDIAYMATQAVIPVIDAGLARTGGGRVTWLPGGDSACYGCLLPPRTRAGLLDGAASPQRSCWNPTDPGSPPWSAVAEPAAVISAMQVEIGLRELAGNAPAFTIEIPDHRRPECTVTLLHARDPYCPFHVPPLPRRAAANASRPVDLLEGAGADAALLLDWPICVAARCLRCGHVWEPCERLALFRRRASCPLCTADAPLCEAAIHSVTRSSPYAHRSFRGLGLPAHHRHIILGYAS